MRSLVDLPAPAKLNLFLHILGRRADGLHRLQSAFVLIDWCDRLHIELRHGGALSREDLGTPLPSDDLCLRAARALQAVAGTTLGAHIAVDKQIPSEAGLGGGSSDAATCLLALNRLWNCGFGTDELARVGLSVGADVPFFVRGQNAWVEGVGDEMQPLPLPDDDVDWLVVKPPQGLSTATVFAHPELERATPPATIAGFAARPWEFGRNDLQPVAAKLCDGVDEALKWFENRGLSPRMTGSGSAVFARLTTDQSIDIDSPASGKLEGWQARRCRMLAEHPLAEWV